MLRTTCAGLMLAAGMAMVGCNSMNSMGSDGYRGGEGIRFDANGNKIHDPSVSNTSGSGNYSGYNTYSGSSNGSYNGTPGMGNSYNGGTPNNEPNSSNNWNNTDRTPSREWQNRDGRDMQGRDRMRDNWSGHWDDSSVMSVNESDLPGNVRTTFSREAGAGTINEYHKGMWDGRPAYCAKVQRNGMTYKVVTDQDGNVLASRQINPY